MTKEFFEMNETDYLERLTLNSPKQGAWVYPNETFAHIVSLKSDDELGHIIDRHPNERIVMLAREEMYLRA